MAPRLIAAFVLLVSLLGCASASQPSLSSLVGASPQEAATVSEPEPEAEDEAKRSAVGFLFGYATERAGEGGAKIGIEYEYDLWEHLGFGVFANYIHGDFHVGVFGVLLYTRLLQDLVLSAGPGFEWRSEEVDGDKVVGLIRTGVLYEFELDDSWWLGPTEIVDFLDGHPNVGIFGVDLFYVF